MGALEVPAEIRAVLDHTALQSYARGHIHVGELFGEVTKDENAVVAIPSVALLEAHARSVDDPHAKALLNYLVTLPGAMVLDLDLATVPEAAGYVRILRGNLPRAHTAWAAGAYRAVCVTTEPEEYPEQVLDDQVVAIPTKDA
ncbi:MAG TPA: hypothetical protein VH502_11495 [Actinoplanes sp.]|jgi:hypothetical protein